jgi:hypothetical protein
LHTHVAVSNKVQTMDGRWLALDGRVLLKATVAASERYNTMLEAQLRDRLGVEFADREPDRPGRRAVREIVGIDQRLLTLFSRRRQAINTRRAILTREFQQAHGRPPTPVEAIEIARRATLDTRQGKPEPASEGEQRADWHAQATTALGGTAPGTLVAGAIRRHREPAHGLDDALFDEVAAAVVERVQADRACWQRWHVLAETQRQLRRHALPVELLDDAVDRVVTRALSEHSIALVRPDVIPEPAPLRRADGSSVYTVAGSQLYTSPAIVAAEQALTSAASLEGGHAVPRGFVDLALLEATANGLAVNEGQAEFVHALAGSGRRCQLALAPAGTGKTTGLRILTRAWIEDGGRVIALAPTAAAARVLGEAVGVPGDTIAKYLHDTANGTSSPIGPGCLGGR